MTAPATCATCVFWQQHDSKRGLCVVWHFQPLAPNNVTSFDDSCDKHAPKEVE